MKISPTLTAVGTAATFIPGAAVIGSAMSGVPSKPALQVSPAQQQNILNANGGSSPAESIKAGSSGMNTPGPTQTSTSAKESKPAFEVNAWTFGVYSSVS